MIDPRVLGGQRGQAALQALREAEAEAERRCLYWRCQKPMAGRRKGARWCSVRCRTYWVRGQRRLTAIRDHPRCCICSKPMPFKRDFGGPGVSYSVRTCSTKCSLVRKRWFGGRRGA